MKSTAPRIASNLERAVTRKSANGWYCLGLCDACPQASGREEVTTLRGQASYKPQGRKPRHAPMGSEKAKAVWGFDDLRCDAQSGRALRAEGEMAGMQR